MTAEVSHGRNGQRMLDMCCFRIKEAAANILSVMELLPARLLSAFSLLSMESSFTLGCPEPTPSWRRRSVSCLSSFL